MKSFSENIDILEGKINNLLVIKGNFNKLIQHIKNQKIITEIIIKNNENNKGKHHLDNEYFYNDGYLSAIDDLIDFINTLEEK